MENEKEKIFVSYTQKDKLWAFWIAAELGKQGYKTQVMDWDFYPGDNFVLKMDEALRTCPIVIAVLSEAYLNSYHCKAELTAAYAEKNQRLIPVRVDDFEVRGLWAMINYIDLVDKTEAEATKLLQRLYKQPERISKGYPGGKISGGTSHNLPNKNNRFTGREEHLEAIYNAFRQKDEGLHNQQNAISESGASGGAFVQARVITGMGGIGKTELAREYAYRYFHEYRHIWWVNAETDANIDEAYLSFAVRYGLGSPKDELDTVRANVRKWMQDNNRWLFIFDNVENEKSLEKYCFSSDAESRHILVTSRNRLFLEYKPININVFTENEACRFIKKYTDIPADEYFITLAKQMGYLPLALDQAGAYMYVHNKSYKEYLALYNQYNLELLEEYDDDPEKKTVATTWQISLDKINNPAAKQLLNLCVFLAPDNILVKWFRQVKAVLPDELQELREIATHDLNYNKSICELTKHSLVSQNEEGALNMHRLVQEVIRDRLKQEQPKWRNYCIRILNELRYNDFYTAESRSLFRLLSPHIDYVTQEISDEEATKEVALLYYFKGKGFSALADYSQSLKYFNKELAICEKVLGTEHHSTVISYNNIGAVYDSQGNYELALEYYGKALAVSEKVLGAEHPDTATFYNNIGSVHKVQGNYDLALYYYGKSLAIREKVLGKEHPGTAISYNNIGLVYYEQGKYKIALDYYGKALTIHETVLGAELPSTATLYNNIGEVYHAQGNFDSAFEYHKKALAICEKVLDKEHPSTATFYNNIGEVYRAKGNFDSAFEYHKKALAIREKVLGTEHPDTANSYNNIGFVCSAQGNFDLTLEYFGKALAILEKVFGAEHPDTASFYSNIGFVHSEQGNFDLALEYYGKALAIREKVLGTEHPDTAFSYNNIGFDHCEQGNYDLALKYYMKALIIKVKVLGTEHPSTKITYVNMVYAYELSGNPEPFEEWIAKKMLELQG